MRSVSPSEFGAFDAMNNVHDVVRLAVELFGDVHHGFRSFDADAGADEGARFAFLLVARSGSWCSVGWLPKFRSHEHVSDISVSFVCDEWWSAKDLGHLSACLQETSVRQDDFAHADSRGVVKDTHDRSLFGGRFAVGLQRFFVGERV